MENRMNLKVIAPLAGVLTMLTANAAWASHCGSARVSSSCCEPQCCYTQYQKVQETCYRDVCETVWEKELRNCTKTVYEKQCQQQTCTVMKNVQETCWKDCTYTVCKPVKECHIEKRMVTPAGK